MAMSGLSGCLSWERVIIEPFLTHSVYSVARPLSNSIARR
nr:MAG TPA_asm: hypothetical protein [Bacteriophage sp.]